MKNGVSEIIGQAIFGDGTKGTAYSALRTLMCASCGRMIAAGEMFTRDRHTGQGLRLWPRCQACVPFAFAPVNRTRSALLKSLLTPTEQKETRAGNLSATERVTTDERKRFAEAMRQRLGPALERTRHTRKGNR